MRDPDAYDRLRYINFMMERLHDSCNELYEHLIDEEVDFVEQEVKEIKEVLKELLDYTSEINK